MTHSIISTIVIGLVLALAFGVVAHRLRLPPLIGYLLAGVAIGPFTPGYVADASIANELAEIGVILLMFGVGLHFSLEDLLSVRGIAVSGAAAQVFLAIPLALALGWWQGWTPVAGVIFGIALSVASTVVVLRLLQERRLIETERGRITVGWLIVQDLAMVLVLVLLPPLAGALNGEAAVQSQVLIQSLVLTLAKIAGFVALMLIVGTRLIPALLHYVAHTGSRELFRLSVLSIALGVAYASTILFGVSLALGAFFAGMVLSESRLSQQAATESLPFRDAFCRAFFRLGGHAVRSKDHVRCAGRADRHRTHHCARQVHRRLFGCTPVRAPPRHRAHHFRQSRADRRVLLHTCSARLAPYALAR